jgi:hypothetical protein
MKNPSMESVDGGEQRLWPARRTAPAGVKARRGELDIDDGPTQQRSSGSEGASSGARRCSGWSRLRLWKRWHGVVKSGEDRRLDEAAAALGS